MSETTMIPEFTIELPFGEKGIITRGRNAGEIKHVLFAPSLNTIGNMNRFQRMDTKERIAKYLGYELEGVKVRMMKKPHIIFERYSTGKGLDWDNLHASFKFICDAIIDAGFIKDDDPETLDTENVKARNVRVPKMEQRKIVIKISDLSPE